MKKSFILTTLLSLVTFSIFAAPVAPPPSSVIGRPTPVGGGAIKTQTVKVFTPSVTINTGKKGIQTKSVIIKKTQSTRSRAME